MSAVRGFRFAGVAAGVKANGRPDLGILAAERPVAAAAVFTQNRLRAAPVILSEQRLRKGHCRAVVVNSGNANACTGSQGRKDAEAMARRCAAALGAEDEAEVAVASTGVIGLPLPMAAVARGIDAAAARLAEGEAAFTEFATAILTTDKAPKVHAARARLGAVEVKVAGCAKGAGMIAPNLATTLAFVVTDAAADRVYLRKLLREESDATFNTVLVDGDTSTNDSLFLLASGAAGQARPVREDDRDGKKLRAAVREVLEALATMLVRDGEGAKRVVKIVVSGAESDRAARAVARRIAVSPLVKTAITGADPNWGRILCAVGNAGVAVDPEAIDVRLGDVLVVKNGVGVLDGDGEARAHEVMSRASYEIRVDLGAGRASAHATTCDLTHEYIDINASYRS
jgi:glutamate N-acetyltransferase / amino-acid N-acetyltransferase